MDREEFMAVVYGLLADDPDNNRSNEIIEAADEYAEDAAKEALESKDTEKRLMDVTSSRWIIDNFNNPDAFPVEFEECPKCGAIYIKALGHDCKDGHEVPFHPKER